MFQTVLRSAKIPKFAFRSEFQYMNSLSLNSLWSCNPHSFYSSILVINNVISHQWILGDTSETKFIPKIASVLFPITIFSISAWQATIRTRLLLTSHTGFFMFPPRWPSLIKVCLIRALIEVSNGKSHALTTLIAPAISSQIKSHYCFTLLWDCCVTWHGLTMTRHPINRFSVIVCWTSAMIVIQKNTILYAAWVHKNK